MRRWDLEKFQNSLFLEIYTFKKTLFSTPEYSGGRINQLAYRTARSADEWPGSLARGWR